MEGKEYGKGIEIIFKEIIITENLPKLGKNFDSRYKRHIGPQMKRFSLKH
jgi:hypothetical protein